MGSIFPDRITLLEYPIAIKHLFDFLDERARAYNITDPEVIHTWKNNSVVLRFWVNMLKNPQFILDIDMPPPVDSTLSTIAQVNSSTQCLNIVQLYHPNMLGPGVYIGFSRLALYHGGKIFTAP